MLSCRLLARGLFLATLLASSPLKGDERILDYDTDISVLADGVLEITETIHVRSEGNAIRRGIYRDFPTRYRDGLGNRVNVAFDVVDVQRDGQTEAWHTANRSNGVRVYMGTAGRMLPPGEHIYVLRYTTDRQLGFFDTFDELYFNAIPPGWAFPIDAARVTVRLPESVSTGDLTWSVYTGRAGSKASDARVTVMGPGAVQFRITRSLAPREGMTISLSWPKGVVTEPSVADRTGWFLSDNGAAIAMLVGLLIALAWYLWAWNRYGRDPASGTIIPRFKAPAGLSPAACRYILRMRFDNKTFSAALISLAVQGRIQIEEEDKEYAVTLNPEGSTSRSSKGENALLEELFDTGVLRVEFDDKEHKRFRAAQHALKNELAAEFHRELFKYNIGWALPGVGLTLLAALVAFTLPGGPVAWVLFVVTSIVLLIVFGILLRAPTIPGRKVMDEIEGLKMYLDTAEQDRLDRMRSPEMTPEVFESFLPYAHALGVANTWCERFARELPREASEQTYQPSWYSGPWRGPAVLSHLGQDFGSDFSSAIASASSPPGSSSGGGGGGFSGGGGGGGGGGGW